MKRNTLVSLTEKRSPGSAARRYQQPCPIKHAVNGGESIDDDTCTPRRSLDARNFDHKAAMPPPAKRSRMHPMVETTTKRKTLCNGHRDAPYRVQHPKGLLLLSFPLKLHLMLQRCELEVLKRTRSKKDSRKENDRGGDDRSSDDKDATSSEPGTDETVKGKSSDTIIGWLPGNNSFKIYDEKRFVKEIMPHFFLGHGRNHLSFETFQRNLELWGFTHMVCVEGPTTRVVHVCSHPLFVKGKPAACNRMKFRIDYHSGQW